MNALTVLIGYFILYIDSIAAIKGDLRGGRIIGGDDVDDIIEYPFSTSLITNGGVGDFEHACGGSILTATAILSAASCFYTGTTLNPESWWRARVGSTFSDSRGTIHQIRRITPHPDFSLTSMDNDIAVLRTTFAMNLQPGVVEAAYIAGAAFSLQTQDVLLAIGWGATSETDTSISDTLQVAEIFVIDQATCVERYNELDITITSNMVCAGWQDVGVRGQCQGDAGSPLLREGVVAGVFSRAEGCGHYRYLGINTRVNLYTNWIVTTATAA